MSAGGPPIEIGGRVVVANPRAEVELLLTMLGAIGETNRLLEVIATAQARPSAIRAWWDSPSEELIEILTSIADRLCEVRDGQERLLARLGASSDSRSSVEVKSSTRGVDVTAKSYDGSDIEGQVVPAVAAYFEAVHLVAKGDQRKQ